MGALHEGHAALIRKARKLAGNRGTVAVTIFVNPKQFAAHEDLSKYPRPLAADLAICRRENADVVFNPSVEEMYASDHSIMIEESCLSRGLCGVSRPGHFSGAITVITKFLNIITPDVVVFGEKDWQQLALVRRLVRDLNYGIRVIAHPTIREDNSLALSSRNVYLQPEERTVAPQIYASLMATAKLACRGKTDVPELLKITRDALLTIPKIKIDYVSIVESDTLEPLTKLIPGKTNARLLIAVFLGKTRLIDNVSLVP